jgi:hypothetical protein
MLTRRLVLGTALLALAACASGSPGDQAARRAKIDANADAALQECQCRTKFPQKRRSKFPQVTASSIRRWPERGLWAWAVGRGGAVLATAG